MTPYGKKGLSVRVIYLAIAFVWWLGSGCGWRHRKKTVVLCYHNVTSGQRHRFEKQMRMIASRVGTVSSRDQEIMRFRPAVCVTFDDAFEGIREHALPALTRHEIQATVFTPTGCLGHSPSWAMPTDHVDRLERLLSDEACRELDGSAWLSFESHTVSHPSLASLKADDCKRELVDSKATLEALLGRQIHDLALPYGEGNERVFNMARRAGYERIFTLEPGFHDPTRKSFFIKRFSVSPELWPIEFRLTVDGAYVWLSLWRRAVRRVRSSVGNPAPHGTALEATS
ncbi:MAG: polysaccharide deacetylase family protein [Planctomycetota bacterium]|nr:polysaccharide deacetylase family protein [Planctomycetota bacterium]